MSISKVAVLAMASAYALFGTTSGYTQERAVEIVTPGLRDAAPIQIDIGDRPTAKGYEAGLWPYSPLKLDYEPLNPPPALAQFLEHFATVAETRDYNALELLVAEQIFWEADHGGGWQENNSGYENLLRALSLDPETIDPAYLEGNWLYVEHNLLRPALQFHSERDGVMCTRPEPDFINPELAFATFEAMQSDFFVDWVYVLESAPVFREADDQSSLLSTVETEALLLDDWEGWADDFSHPQWAKIVLPSGLDGYIPFTSVYEWTGERLCFGRMPSGKWKIVGYFGGGL